MVEHQGRDPFVFWYEPEQKWVMVLYDESKCVETEAVPAADLTLNNRNINREMVSEGWAWAYRQYLDRPHASEYIEAEEKARGKRLGLWAQTNPQPPWEFRKLQKKGKR